MQTIKTMRQRYTYFNSIVERIRHAGTDNPSHFGNGYTHEGGYSLQQNPDEFAALTLTLLTKRSASYFEIGSASGGAARFLHEYNEFEQMFSIDDGGHHRYGELPANFENLPIEHVKLDSHTDEAKEWVKERARYRPFDVVFIDGDHSEEGVWQDVELMRPYWVPGAYVILHDIVTCDGVEKAWHLGAYKRYWVKYGKFVGDEIPLGIGVGVAV